MEMSGIVAAVGERVRLWQPGDRVMAIEAGGCYAEQSPSTSASCSPSPRRSATEDGAAIPEVFLTAWDALVLQGGLTSGRWALVHAGASGVGTAAIQIAKAIGARIAVTCSAGKADACRELGADLVLERSPHDWAADATAAVPGRVRHRPRRHRRRRGQPQPPGRRATGHDRPGRADGWRVDQRQRRAAAGQAGPLGRHHAARPADRGEGRPSCAASPPRCCRCSTRGALRPVIHGALPAGAHRRGPRRAGGQHHRRQDPDRRQRCVSQPTVMRRVW